MQLCTRKYGMLFDEIANRKSGWAFSPPLSPVFASVRRSDTFCFYYKICPHHTSKIIQPKTDSIPKCNSIKKSDNRQLRWSQSQPAAKSYNNTNQSNIIFITICEKNIRIFSLGRFIVGGFGPTTKPFQQ